ncbi:MAG: molybdopterin-synthase adenylyltransferase MoeB [Rhodospirillaceae bacterium]|nr:molybdopterin-synthase adenylyltransferase MoeB [Rhodospirillaceae bacterium]
MDFTEAQIQRYARHILLPEVGGVGQEKLLKARVLVIGAGGLGSPVILYLAAAGVGTIGVVDDDTVDLSNLQRQVLHTTARVGAPKTYSAQAAVAAINPDVKIIPHKARLTSANAMDLISAYDVIADGSDNFATRFLVNDACFFAKKPLVSAAVLRFDGQLATFKPHAGGPCYRCLYADEPPAGQIPTCAEAGILGAVAGVLGTLQATEILKEILGIGQSMAGRLMIYDALDAASRTVKVNRDPACALCGDHPTIKALY